MVLDDYKQTLTRMVQRYYPVSAEELSPVIDYSIEKRYKEAPVNVINNYTKTTSNMTLLKLTEYINSKEPIVTPYGTMFRKHGDVPNPLAIVVQQFLDERGIHKKHMFQFPKGSEEFEKYNLLQTLS